MDKYDVIIVGAGPAGGQCARELADAGHRVLLLERSRTIGEPNFSSAATLKETMATFKLSKMVVQSPWRKISIISRNNRVDIDYGKIIGYVMDYKKLKQFLVADARRKGARVLVGTEAKEPIMEDKITKGIRFSNREAYADVIIDASGNSGFLSSKLGIIGKRDIENSGMGIEYLLSQVKLDFRDGLQFYLGESYVNSGYLWVFPTGKNTAKVGSAWYLASRSGPQKPKLDKFVKSNSQTKGSKVEDFHGGSLVFSYPKTFVKGNVLALGDAGGQCNPLGGEGIRHALLSGRYAASVVSKYLNSKDRKLSALKEYDKLWKGYTKGRWKLSFALANFVYPKMTDQNADKLVNVCKKLPKGYALDVLFYYKFSGITRYWRKLTRAGLIHIGKSLFH